MTAAEINALPARVRKYIHDIETICDPQGMIAEEVLLRDSIEAQYRLIAELKAEKEEALGIIRVLCCYEAHVRDIVRLRNEFDWDEQAFANALFDEYEKEIASTGVVALLEVVNVERQESRAQEALHSGEGLQAIGDGLSEEYVR